MARENNYFFNLSKDSYNGILVTNILANVKIANIISDDIRVFFPYQVQYDETPDVVAYNYYDDVDLDWLVLISNGIIDPYHEWPMSDIIFRKYIIRKYGKIPDQVPADVKHYIKKDNENIEISIDSYNFIINPDIEWTPVTHYEYEQQENENKKIIRLLDKRHAPVAVQNLKNFYINNKTRENLTPVRNVSGLIS